jgi:deoxyribonuclease V
MVSPEQYDQLTPTEAVALQRELQALVRLEPLTTAPTTVGGADISFNKYSETVYAGIVILSFPELQVIDRASVVATARFPYVPGLLSFREVPALMQVWESLAQKPDILVLDGHGIAHPRRLGIASHFGVITDTPTIGCGKSILVGKHEELPAEAGSAVPLIHKGETVGAALRTKNKTSPVFVSPGNRITLHHAVEFIKRCTGKYRIPEPTRQAHLWVNEVRLAGKE